MSIELKGTLEVAYSNLLLEIGCERALCNSPAARLLDTNILTPGCFKSSLTYDAPQGPCKRLFLQSSHLKLMTMCIIFS